MNPFTQDFPVAVLMRNRRVASINRLLPAADAAGFPLQGVVAQNPGVPEAWRADGRWLESGKAHPLDIVAEVTSINEQDDTYTAIPFAPAAGAKGQS